MAEGNVPPVPTGHPSSPLGSPYYHFSTQAQAFYAARGMWVNGEPQGWLASMLGRRMRPDRDLFYVSAEQIGELMRDLTENGRRGLTGQQLGQILRRLREALTRAGVRAPHVYAHHAPAAPAVAVAHNPFMPLTVPAAGRARAAFEKHCFDCLREIVDFQQTADWGQPSLGSACQAGLDKFGGAA